ncbi:hypothetical protein [Umezawaea beigongshangensis]|uniref:hypothetical protein n=1 Tax=Umezawaea beigongshangensis TaxID=2780383 RepID=UPI0018F23CE0|nr:hypothetical protein [Umezawaea beigongshangensis]
MRRGKSQAWAVISLVLLGFIASWIAYLLGIDRSWAFAVAAAVGVISVVVMMRVYRR